MTSEPLGDDADAEEPGNAPRLPYDFFVDEDGQVEVEFYPSFSFRPFTVVADWPHWRWWEHFDGTAGDAVWSIWLAHAEAIPCRQMLVCTYDLLTYGRHVSAASYPVRELAWNAGLVMLNLAVPSRQPDGPPTVRWPAPFPKLDEVADDFARWPAVTWTLDGQPAEAHMGEWAGRWTGIAFADELAVVVHAAADIPTTPLALARTADAARYGLDLSIPPTYTAVQAAHRLGP